ncbi:MAG: matrixin family metalloprotease [Candidatus Paceibacterota bacterium]
MSDYNITHTENTTPLEQDPEPIRPRSTVGKIVRAVIAGIFILSMLYLFGGHQYLRFGETPADIAVREYSSVIQAPLRSIPTMVYVLASNPTDDPDRPRRLVENANQLLAQMAVELSPVSVEEISVDRLDISGPELVANPGRLERILPRMETDELYVVVTPGLGGLNGIAFSGRDTVAVAEHTTGYDFRTLAHEVGHVLGLGHVDDKSNLMYSGSNGTGVTVSQAQDAYEMAENFHRSR